MAEDVLPEASRPLGVWVRERLREEKIAWLTTVDAAGVAQPNPVWFLWDGESILVYNLATARRLAHIKCRPEVTLHLDNYGQDGDAIVLIGVAEIVADEPPADRQPAFLEKYSERMRMDQERWARMFPVVVRIRPTRFRGYHRASPDQQGVT
jgi:PPOX class probable F420-dependent enzyme